MCCEDGSCCCCSCCCCKEDGESCEAHDVFLTGVCSLFAGWAVFIVGLALFLVDENPAMRVSGIVILSLGVTMIVLGFSTCCCIGCDLCECCRDAIGDCCRKKMCCCCIQEDSWRLHEGGCCTCFSGGTQWGGWNHSQPQGEIERRPYEGWSHSAPEGEIGRQSNGGWSHSAPDGEIGRQSNGGWSHSQSEREPWCCLHCVCCEGGIASAWNHRGTRWAQDYAPSVAVVNDGRNQFDPTVLRLEEIDPNVHTWDGQPHQTRIWTTNSNPDVINTQPTAPSIRIHGASGAQSETNSGEPPSYSSIMASAQTHRMRTPGLSPRSGATTFDPPPEYEEVVL